MKVAIWAGLAVLALATPVWAADEEIQVYTNEMSGAGHFGLDVHNNYVVRGDRLAPYPGGMPSRDVLRVTPEFSYGLTDSWDLGLYVLSAAEKGGPVTVGGIKGRLKYIAPKRTPDQDWYWGGNLEIGRVSSHYDDHPWNGEAKLIYGFERGPWLFATNANIGFTLSPGKGSRPVELEVATKLNYKVNDRWQVGVESYNGMGPFKDLGRLSSQSQSLYLVADTRIGAFDLNLGVGRGLTGSADGWTVKAILGVPMP